MTADKNLSYEAAMAEQEADAKAELTGRFMAVATRLPSIYVLDDQAYALLALQDVSDEDLDELGLTREDLARQEDEIATRLLHKLEDYGVVMTEMRKVAQGRRDEQRRMQARTLAAEGALERMKDRLVAHMQANGSRPIETPKFTFRLQANPKSVVVVDETAIPQQFIVVTYTPSKTAIKDWIKSTGEVPDGVEFVSSGDSLRVS